MFLIRACFKISLIYSIKNPPVPIVGSQQLSIFPSGYICGLINSTIIFLTSGCVKNCPNTLPVIMLLIVSSYASPNISCSVSGKSFKILIILIYVDLCLISNPLPFKKIFLVEGWELKISSHRCLIFVGILSSFSCDSLLNLTISNNLLLCLLTNSSSI